jgi:hypothetical protein
VEKISPLSSSSAERPRPKPRRKHSASGVVLNMASYKESLNMSNTSGFSAAKPKRKRCMLKQKLRLEGSRSLQILRRFSVLFVGKFTTRSGSSERGANIGRMRTDGGYYFYIHVHTNQLWLMFNMYVHCLFLAHYY